MDPLSISASCAGLIALISATSSGASRFFRDCREARTDLTRLVGDLSQLSASLELLRDDTEDNAGNEDRANDALIQAKMKDAVMSHLGQCEGVVSEIRALFKSLGKGKTMPMKWALVWKDRFMPLVVRLRGYSEALGLTIDIVGLQLTKAIKADTERIIAFMEHLNERLNYGVGNPHLLGISMKESRLQEATLKQLPDDSLLERYLDDVSDYAKTVCGDLSSIDFEPGDAGKKEGRPGVHASSRPTLTLQDLAGRQYALPFEDCKTWKLFHHQVVECCSTPNEKWTEHLAGGLFDAINQNSEIVLPTHWEKVVQPGWTVRIVLRREDIECIKFKDAVGRKFNFPFHSCRTWLGMENLIKQTFRSVDVIGPVVQRGCYDLLVGGEIILPQVWDAAVKPDWHVVMLMWPPPAPKTSSGTGSPGPRRRGGGGKVEDGAKATGVLSPLSPGMRGASRGIETRCRIQIPSVYYETSA